MFKVLIADDEEKVCQLIKNLIVWEELGLEVVACANDGIEALEIIKNQEPDLVITDIRMPGYDGIELIKKAKEINENIEFIIISGYKHFDYAHNAIKFGVEDYLLKPLKKNEFTNALKKTVHKFEERDKQLDKKELLELQIENDKNKLRAAFMVNILFNRDGLRNDLEVEAVNKEYHFSFVDDNFQAIVVKTDLGFKEDNKNIDKLLKDKSVEIIKTHLDNICHELVIYCSNMGIYCILNFDDDAKQCIRKLYKSIIDEIIAMNDLFANLKITIGVGNFVSNINDLNESLLIAKEAVNARITLGVGRVIEGEGLTNEIEGISSKFFLDAETMKSFSGHISSLDIEGVKGWFDDLSKKLSENPDINGNLIIDISNDIVDAFLFNLKKQNTELKDKNAFMRSYGEKLYRCCSISEIFEMIILKISEQLEIIIEEKQNTDIKPIRETKQYMQQNYNKAITLEDVSNIAGFNATYFSYFFKKETGMNFLEYLVSIRVGKAKELLVDTNKSVAKIAESVGYIDLKHFSKLFKKQTGLTPSEYRKIYQ